MDDLGVKDVIAVWMGYYRIVWISAEAI